MPHDIEVLKREQVPPAALQTILLDDIAAGIRLLIELTERGMPEGRVAYLPHTASTTLEEIRLEPPWFSIHIIHDASAGNLLVQFNDRSSRAIELRPAEDMEFDLHGPLLERLFVQASVGTIAFRILGVH